MKEKEFESRYYGRGELAMMYFPNQTEESARSSLRRELAANPRLCYLLKSKRRFSPKQVRQIVSELDDPP